MFPALEQIKTLQEELEKMRLQYKEAETTVNLLTDKLNEISKEHEITKRDSETINKKFEEKQELCLSKDDEINRLQAKIQSLSQNLVETSSAFEKLERESKGKEILLQKEVERLKMEASSKSLDAESTKDELNKKNVEIETLHKRVFDLKKEIEIRSVDLERYQQNQDEIVANLKRDLENAHSALKAKISELEELSTEKSKEICRKEIELDEARTLVKRNNTEIEALKAEIESLKVQERDAQSEIFDRHMRQIDEKDAIIMQLKEEINKKVENIENFSNLIAKLETDVRAKTEDVERVRSNLESVEQKYHLQTVNVSKSTQQINELQLKTGDLESQLKLAEEKYNNLMQQKVVLEKERDTFINSSDNIDVKLQELSKELAEKQNTLEKVQDELAKSEQLYRTMEQELNLKVNNLMHELEQQKQQHQEYENAVLVNEKLYNDKCEVLNAESAKLKEELTRQVRNLKSTLEEKDLILQKTLEEASENDRQLKDELSRVTMEYQRDRDQYQAKISEMSAEALEAKNLAAQRTEDAIEMDARYKHLLAESERSDIATRSEYAANMSKLQFELDESRHQIEHLTNEISRLNENSSHSEASIAKRDGQLTTLNTELRMKRDLVEQLQTEKDNLQSLYDEQCSKNATNKEEYNTLVKRIVELTEKANLADEYAAKLAAERSGFIDVLNHLQITEDTKNDTLRRLKQMNSDIVDLVQEVKAAEFDERKLKMEEMQKLIDNTKSDVLEKDHQLRLQEDEAARLRSELLEVNVIRKTK